MRFHHISIPNFVMQHRKMTSYALDTNAEQDVAHALGQQGQATCSNTWTGKNRSATTLQNTGDKTILMPS